MIGASSLLRQMTTTTLRRACHSAEGPKLQNTQKESSTIAKVAKVFGGLLALVLSGGGATLGIVSASEREKEMIGPNPGASERFFFYAENAAVGAVATVVVSILTVANYTSQTYHSILSGMSGARKDDKKDGPSPT